MLNRTLVSLSFIAAALVLGGPARLDLARAAPGPEPSVPDVIDIAFAPWQSGAETIEIEGWVIATAELSVEARRLTVATIDGTFEVDVSASTAVRATGGGTMAADEIGSGHRVVIAGDVRADARIEAGEVIVEAPPPTADGEGLEIRGRVVAVLEASATTAGRTLAIIAENGAETVVELTTATRIEGSVSVQAGQHVRITARGGGDGRTAVASDLDVLAPGRPTRVRIEGGLAARAEIDGGAGDERWIVGRVAMDVDASLAAESDAVVGARVRISAGRGGDGELAAIEITGLEVSIERIEVRGTVEARGASSVTIEGVRLEIDGETSLEGDVEVGAFVSAEATLELDGRIVADRLVEITLGPVSVYFEGPIESIDLLAGTWVVADTTVTVNPLTTTITGLLPLIGLHAEVSARLEGSAVVATAIHVEADALGGLTLLDGTLIEVGGVPGTWRVLVLDIESGLEITHDVLVDTETVIDESAGAAEVGATVQIHAELTLDLSYKATAIRVVRGSA